MPDSGPTHGNTGAATNLDLRARSFIGFDAGTGCESKFQAINPVDGNPIAPAYCSANAEDLDRAVGLAAEAFPVYSRASGKTRAAFLRTIADRIQALDEQLVDRVVQETALPAARARSEMGRTCNQLRLFADVIDEGSWVMARIDPALPERKPLPRPDLRSMLRPLGPVAVFCASNFPLAFSVAGGDTASALAAGNPVVVKAHSAHPGTAELVGVALRESVRQHGLPQGVFSLLFDAGLEVGTALVRHPEIKAVGFTGSRAGGQALMKYASSRPDPIPFYAEMSSVNPVFILPGAMLERCGEIAQGLYASITLGAGQFCTKPGIVIVNDGSDAQRFLRKLHELVSPGGEFTLLHRGIHSAYKSCAEERSRHARKLAEGTSGEADGFHVAAVAFETDAKVYLADPGLSEELFGPSTVVVRGSHRNELLEIARRLEGHLTATIHGTAKDLADYHDLVEILERKVGRLIFNGFPTGVEVSHAMVHGGPYPATSDGRSTSVGTMAIFRFARPVCFQGFPSESLPTELQNANPLGIWRMIDGQMTRGPL